MDFIRQPRQPHKLHLVQLICCAPCLLEQIARALVCLQGPFNIYGGGEGKKVAISREKKEKIVKDVKEKLEKSKVAVFADYRGITAGEITQLRRNLRESGSELKIAKNTLTKIAARDLGLDGLDPYLEGPVAIAFGYEDAVAPAKILAKFIKEHKKMEIKGGVLEKAVVDAAGIKDLADLPPKEVLLARVVGGMQAPISGLVNVLQGSIRNLVYALEAVRKQKAEESA